LNWERYNPILAKGEICVEDDTGRIKVGIGLDWKRTSYYGSVEGNSGIVGNIITDHDDLGYDSRSAPNQHPIESVIGLKPQITVHVGDDEPIESAHTWIKTIEDLTTLPERSSWSTIYSTPLIRYAQQISPAVIFDNNFPIRLLVVGTVEGKEYQQEFHIEFDKRIRGEALIYLDDNPDNTRSAEFEIYLNKSHFYVTKFQSTGNQRIIQFTGLRLEVYQ